MAYARFLLCFFLVLFSVACPRPELSGSQAGTIISAKPIAAFETGDPSRRRFGALEFRGGLVLTSSNRSFGGFSALCVQRDGAHFVALSDRASWLRGRIVYEGNRPVGISEASMAPVLDEKGEAAPKWDTESIAEDRGRLYVGLERTNRILRYDFGNKGFLAHAEPVDVPPGIKELPFNQGLEALVFVPNKYPLGGTLIAISERGLDDAGNIKSFLIGGPNPGGFTMKRTKEFDPSDAAFLPDGDLLVLERKYSMQSGVSMRIRRIPLRDIKPGALVDCPVIIEADSQFQIDNMEALSVHRSHGETVLTLMSDDNFSAVQRTLLLQFALK